MWLSAIKLAVSAGSKIYANKQKTAYEIRLSLVGSEMCIRDSNNTARLDLDTMKAMMDDQQHDEKLEQNQELAGLRAGVSLTKQTMADASKINDFGRNFKKK